MRIKDYKAPELGSKRYYTRFAFLPVFFNDEDETGGCWLSRYDVEETYEEYKFVTKPACGGILRSRIGWHVTSRMPLGYFLKKTNL